MNGWMDVGQVRKWRILTRAYHPRRQRGGGNPNVKNPRNNIHVFSFVLPGRVTNASRPIESRSPWNERSKMAMVGSLAWRDRFLATLWTGTSRFVPFERKWYRWRKKKRQMINWFEKRLLFRGRYGLWHNSDDALFLSNENGEGIRMVYSKLNRKIVPGKIWLMTRWMTGNLFRIVIVSLTLFGSFVYFRLFVEWIFSI